MSSPFVVPPYGEEVVIPPELASAWAEVLANRGVPDWWDWSLLENRRLIAYYDFYSADWFVRDQVHAGSVVMSETHFNALVAELTERTGSAANFPHFWNERSYGSVGLVFEQEYTRGQLAWIADWILLNFATEVDGVSAERLYGGHNSGAGGSI